MSNYTNTVDSMGDAAICKALLEKTLAEITDTHCTTIGGYAFYKFYDLRKAIFENATRIEQYAFAYCSKLETVEIPLAENVGYFSFYECTKLKKADFPNVKSVNRYAFNGCTALETLALRSTTMATLTDVNALVDTRIEDGKGYIYVPSALIDSYKTDSKWSTYANQFRRLEDYTVDGTITGEVDTNRYTIRFLNGTTVLQTSIVPYGQMPVYAGSEPVPEEDYAFIGWYPEIAVVTGDVDYVAQFKYAGSVTRSILRRTIKEYSDETVTSIGSYAFSQCSALTSVNMPLATSIGSNAFYYCSKLTSVNMPLATSIGYEAFRGCSQLTSVDMPSATDIGSSAFSNCSKLTSVDLPNVTSIGGSAFQYCSALTSVNMPLATSIGGSAFQYCSALTSVRLPATPPKLSNVSAFNGINNECRFYIPTGSLAAYQSATNWSSLTSTYSFVEEDR